jgi:cell division protein FtsB
MDYLGRLDEFSKSTYWYDPDLKEDGRALQRDIAKAVSEIKKLRREIKKLKMGKHL